MTPTIDYRSFGPDGPVSRPPAELDLQWWMQDGDEAAHAISGTLEILRGSQSTRLAEYEICARLYGNTPTTPGRVRTVSPFRDTTPTFNVVQSTIDTALSMLARNKPKPYYLTSGGNFRQRRKAKRLNKFAEGIFYECGAYRLGHEARRDGLVYGDGKTHVFERNGRVCMERVLPEELFVDDLEARYGNPRQMHRVRQVDRSVLRQLFPSKGAALQYRGDAPTMEITGTRALTSDLVTVRESWHLPSGPKAKDGKHIITIDGYALTKMEPWEHDFFPFATFRWSPRLTGYWSQGAAEQLRALQIEITKIDKLIARSIHLGGTFKVVLPIGSQVPDEHINNNLGTLIHAAPGFEPKYILPPVVQPELYERRRELIHNAFDQIGISQLAATSQKPAGLDSGRALREYSDINSDRFRTVGESDEEYHLDLARLAVVVARDIAKRDGSYKVKVPGSRATSDVDWKEIDLDEDAYVMQCFPVSSLPTDPAGRLQQVQEYAQAGYLSPRQARRLLDFPDIEQVETLANAGEEHLTKELDRLVEGDPNPFPSPETYDDLAMARELALQYYQEGKAQGLEEDRLELLRRYLSQIDALEASAPPVEVAPAGVPEAAPVSDLLPNSPALRAA